jgi:hypothetical protein
MKVSVDAAKEPRSSLDLVRNSLLYRELSAEHEEVLRHKWIESEKMGRDIGFGAAQVDWNLKHRSHWRRQRRQKLC